MKKIGLLVISAIWLFAEVAWQPDYDTAVEAAKKENKPLLVLLVSHTCHWCRKLENRTLENPAVSDYIAKHFVPVLVYRGDGEYPEEKIHSSHVPTTFVFTPDGDKELYSAIGYSEPSEYLSDLKVALDRFKAIEARR